MIQSVDLLYFLRGVEVPSLEFVPDGGGVVAPGHGRASIIVPLVAAGVEAQLACSLVDNGDRAALPFPTLLQLPDGLELLVDF